MDEEVDEEEIEAANETDPDREASDRADIEGVAQEVDKELALSETDINLGCFALTKVCCMQCMPMSRYLCLLTFSSS